MTEYEEIYNAIYDNTVQWKIFEVMNGEETRKFQNIVTRLFYAICNAYNSNVLEQRFQNNSWENFYLQFGEFAMLFSVDDVRFIRLLNQIARME